MTAPFPGNRNEDLFRSPADWVSPGNQGGWRKSPPKADGRQRLYGLNRYGELRSSPSP